MNHRVLFTVAAAKIFQHRAHIGAAQQLGKIVGNPRNAPVHFGAGDAHKNLVQKRVGFNKDRVLAGETAGLRPVAAAGGEQAICGGLRLHIGKLLHRQLRNQRLAVIVQQPAQVAVLFFIALQYAHDAAIQKPRLGRHAPGKFGGGGDGEGVGAEKFTE